MPKIDYDDSYVIIKQIYPIIEQALEKNDTRFRSNISSFINSHHDLLFDIAPYDRIYFNQKDIDDMYNSLGLKESDIENLTKNCFFYDKPYNPQCAKEPYVITLMMCIRYYLKHSKSKFAELTTIYTAFSGKFYASIHAGIAFPKVAPSKYKTVMDFVVNNMLSNKYDLKREGTVFGAIKSLCISWIEKYESILISNDTSDDEIGKLVQQLRDREKKFLVNIASKFYEAFTNKNYLNYETENLSQEEFRLTDNDAATAARITENVMNTLTSTHVSLDICNKCKDQNVKAIEIKDILETILSDNKNLPNIRRVINILICDFMRNCPGSKVNSVEFVSYSIKLKPNTKDEYILEQKAIILNFLEENSPTYRKRKSRKATQISYYRSILIYFILLINKVANR